LPQLPRLVHRALAEDRTTRVEEAIARLERTQARQVRMLFGIVAALALLAAAVLLR
jgi:hypothetical protein